jgi:hypothetical protein
VKAVTRSQRFFALGLMSVLTAMSLVLPTIAAATPGDPATPLLLPPLPWSAPQTGTLVPLPIGGLFTINWCICTVPLAGGQTIRVDLGVDPGVGESMVMLGAPGTAPYDVVSELSSAPTQTLTACIPYTGEYELAIIGKNPGSFSLDVTSTPPAAFELSTLSAPKSVRRRRAFSVSVSLNPTYNGLTSPIRYILERKVGRKWRAYGKVNGAERSDYSVFGEPHSRFSARVRISKSGTYRIRARFMDSVHPDAVFTSWRSIRVR